VRRAKTDSVTGFTFNPEARPEKSNLLGILAAVTGRTVEVVAAEHASSGAAAFKDALADALIAEVVPIGDRVSAGPCSLSSAPWLMSRISLS
jgi:tryptophanyl-tRNA synthetase